MRRPYFLAALVASLSLLAARTQAEPAAEALFAPKALDFERTSAKVVGAYVANWQPLAQVEAIPSGSLSHILYAFLRLCGPGQLPADAVRCEGKEDFQLASSEVDRRFDAAFARLKERAPQLKVLASVGGWGGSDPFFHLAGDAARRAVFAASVQQFLREHPAFDGIDIDWEHPGGNGAANGVQLGSPTDGQGYADLMLDLRRALDRLTAETGRPYLLSTAVNSTQAIVQRINFRQAAPALDLVFMMTYDFYGAWTPGAGPHSALRSSAPDADDSLERSVQNLVAAGVPKSKLVAGVAMYGRGFSGVSKPVSGAAKSGVYPGADGSAGYREIAQRYLGPRGQGLRGYRALFDAQTESWSLYHPRLKLWMGYDDPRAVLAKGHFVNEQGLAGLFAWELSQDNGAILNAMNRGLGHLALPEAAQRRP